VMRRSHGETLGDCFYLVLTGQPDTLDLARSVAVVAVGSHTARRNIPACIARDVLLACGEV
jgi:hypothetical protein